VQRHARRAATAAAPQLRALQAAAPQMRRACAGTGSRKQGSLEARHRRERPPRSVESRTSVSLAKASSAISAATLKASGAREENKFPTSRLVPTER
jgi:hypothetical protein